MNSFPKQKFEPFLGNKNIRGVSKISISKKSVRQVSNPQSTDGQTIAWQFHRRDHEDSKWGWSRMGDAHVESILKKHLHHLETMTWNELLRASGGRSQGNNHHSISVDRLSDSAIQRLVDLKLDDIDELFSLRLTGKIRLWGIKDGRVLKLLWYDEEHTVYPLS